MTPDRDHALEELLDDFTLLDNWEDRYRYIMDMGKTLEPLAEHEHDETNEVYGCVSKLWLVATHVDGRLRLRGDSDTDIMRGFIAVLICLYSGKTPCDVLDYDIRGALVRLGLEGHLTPQRANGFRTLVDRIRTAAAAPPQQ